jgi:predicted Zn-dependent protease
MRTCIAIVLSLVCLAGFAQAPQPGRQQNPAAYPESEAAAAWRALAASYVRKALREQKLNSDPALNARVDAVMAGIGRAAAAIDTRFANANWKAILIEDFGHGAVAFPGETILVDARFVRALALTDDELALVLAHEVGHVIGGHAYEKLSFMAETLGRDKAPTARTALLEFLSKNAYAEAFQPVAQLQEREADRIGAAILFASAYDAQRAMALFDKLALRETRREPDTHDPAAERRRSVAAVLAQLREATAAIRP